MPKHNVGKLSSELLAALSTGFARHKSKGCDILRSLSVDEEHGTIDLHVDDCWKFYHFGVLPDFPTNIVILISSEDDCVAATVAIMVGERSLMAHERLAKAALDDPRCLEKLSNGLRRIGIEVEFEVQP